MQLVSGDWLLVSGGKDTESDIAISEKQLQNLSKQKLQVLRDKIGEIRKKKYPDKHERKYGNLNKGFTEEELKKFLKGCRNEKTYLAFSLMANLGLRVGEVVMIRIDEIDFVKNKIKIFTEKAHTVDFMHLHSGVRKLLNELVRIHPDEILKHEGFILFPNSKSRSKRQHISSDWLRNEFRRICYVTGLDEHYGEAEDTRNPIKAKNGVRKLHRLTTHSLRHYYISKVYRHSKNPLFTQKLARHGNFKSTQTYIHISQKEVDDTLEKTFEQNNDRLDKGDFMALLELARMLKE